MAISIDDRLHAFFDDGKYAEIKVPEPVSDPLRFRDERKYVDRIRDARRKTGQEDAMRVAAGTVEGLPMVAACQNFAFMGGSMGMALGEAFLTAAEEAVSRKAALVVFTASGGARMQEGILSLMQMPRTTIAVQMMREAQLPFIVILTNPTTGGVTASFAMLGDVHIAEPGALICFAGPRVIEQTIREKLPEGFQRSEFLLEKGMVDCVVHRRDLRKTVSQIVRVFTKSGTVVQANTKSSSPDLKVAAESAQGPKKKKKTGTPSGDNQNTISINSGLDKAAE